MRRVGVFFLLGVFVAAFAVHPLVHAEDHGGHACLLTLPGQETPRVASLPESPAPLFAGSPAFTVCAGHPPALADEHLSRAPPSSL